MSGISIYEWDINIWLGLYIVDGSYRVIWLLMDWFSEYSLLKIQCSEIVEIYNENENNLYDFCWWIDWLIDVCDIVLSLILYMIWGCVVIIYQMFCCKSKSHEIQNVIDTENIVCFSFYRPCFIRITTNFMTSHWYTPCPSIILSLLKVIGKLITHIFYFS